MESPIVKFMDFCFTIDRLYKLAKEMRDDLKNGEIDPTHLIQLDSILEVMDSYEVDD